MSENRRQFDDLPVAPVVTYTLNVSHAENHNEGQEGQARIIVSGIAIRRLLGAQ